VEKVFAALEAGDGGVKAGLDAVDIFGIGMCVCFALHLYYSTN
jgi:hypothetical protein